MAPSSLIVSPFNIGFKTMLSTKSAYSHKIDLDCLPERLDRVRHEFPADGLDCRSDAGAVPSGRCT
ncbi:hypothetical protein EDC40_107158 [Aminobacter aminovorans]|jgi:hypothetical protein|uniref:Uncharacterized protein n=1 Tax=Aminobacter aminovorans TaxID=83263 RepID=A0A381ILN2_AMIAI|nr:hypothetical protein EDC40_107158 [Aminobacter aminovorans]SUY28640.1 Uncharacterised protein [Aminobacter aminovorans]